MSLEPKYYLRINAIGQYPEVSIDSERYTRLKRSRSVLAAAVAREEIYEVLVTNYRAFEQEVVAEAVATMVQRTFDYSEISDSRLALNAAVANVLSAARLYVEQVCSKTGACDPSDPELPAKTKALLSAQYDSVKSYKFMEAFRNHVQHAGLPIDSMSFGSKRNDGDDLKELEYYITISANKKVLLQNDGFKKTALEGFGEEIDLLETTRGYIEALSSVQAAVRLSTKQSVDHARSEISTAISQYSSSFDQKMIGLHAMRVEDGKWVETIPLLLDWDDVRKKLELRNPRLINLSKGYASSRIHPIKAKKK